MSADVQPVTPVSASEAVTCADSLQPYRSVRMTAAGGQRELNVQMLAIATLRDYYADAPVLEAGAGVVPPTFRDLAARANERLGRNATLTEIGAAAWLAWVAIESGWRAAVLAQLERDQITVDPRTWPGDTQQRNLASLPARYGTELMFGPAHVAVLTEDGGAWSIYTGKSLSAKWTVAGDLLLELEQGRASAVREGG